MFPASERVNDAVAEPVVLHDGSLYVVGVLPCACGYAQGAGAIGLRCLAFTDSAHYLQPGAKPGASAPNRFYMYGVVGRLAMLAASYELRATDPDAERYN